MKKGGDQVAEGEQEPKVSKNYGEPRQAFRYNREDWQTFVSLTPNGPSAELRGFIDWYIRKKGAKAPKRPPAPTE